MAIFTPHTNNSTGGIVINTQEFIYQTCDGVYGVLTVNYHPSEGVSKLVGGLTKCLVTRLIYGHYL